MIYASLHSHVDILRQAQCPTAVIERSQNACEQPLILSGVKTVRLLGLRLLCWDTSTVIELTEIGSVSRSGH